MATDQTKKNASKFLVPIGPAFVMGAGACLAFYWFVWNGPIQSTLLQRFVVGNSVSILAVGFFFTSLAILSQKWFETRRQNQLLITSTRALLEITQRKSDLDDDASELERSQWFAMLWKTQSKAILESWLGRRVTELVSRQVIRRTTVHLSDDIRELATADHEKLKSSYSFLQVLHCSILLLGLLGTSIALSDAFTSIGAQTATEATAISFATIMELASHVFDSIGLGLGLTVLSLFAMHIVRRFESSVLSRLDSQVSDVFYESLPCSASKLNLSVPESTSTNQLLRAIESLSDVFEKRSEQVTAPNLSSSAIPPSLSADSIQLICDSISKSIQLAVEQAVPFQKEQLERQVEALSRIQIEGAVQIDARLQQWQTTISEQARASLRQQQEMNRLSETLQELIESNKFIETLEGPSQARLMQVTNIDRFHDAAICLTEAVAVLGTQMERYGYLGRQPIRRRGEDQNRTNQIAQSSMPGSQSSGPFKDHKPDLRVFNDSVGESVDDSNSVRPPVQVGNLVHPKKRIAG